MLTKVTGATLYEQVMVQIREMIVKGIYQKGDMLPSEKELMQLTGVSRITVREALRALAEVGIIETRQGKGSFVRMGAQDLAPDLATAEQQSEYRKRFMASNQARLLIEPQLAQLAAKNATPEDLARLEATLPFKKGGRTAGEGSFDEFHRAVAEAAGNPLLLEFLEHLLDLERQGRSAFRLTFPEEQKSTSTVLKDHHWKIFEAIRDGNAEFAYFYMKEHTLHLLKSYEEYFQQFC